jgi:hypothetical protein
MANVELGVSNSFQIPRSAFATPYLKRKRPGMNAEAIHFFCP